MKNVKKANRGQFSIIAALFVAVILISSLMVTYSTIRYSSTQSDPQIASAIDETNMALKQVLGFTVGYYGSVLQVTGNSSYARNLASNYLSSGLENIANVRPEWGSSFAITDLTLSTSWFMNESYSKGTLNVTYSLAGLGISGVSYSASCRLDVQVSQASPTQASVTVVKDENQPLNDLSKKNFRFYLYKYSNSSWDTLVLNTDPIVYTNGTYIIDIPAGINPQSFSIQIQDSRGISVAASSYSHYTGTLTFNNTYVESVDYIDSLSDVYSPSDIGTHSNFASQQASPDGVYDTITEERSAPQTLNYYPTGYSALGLTTLSSGSLSNLAADDSSTMNFRSYASAFSSAYNTIAFDSASSTTISGSSINSMNWQHTTGNGDDRILIVTIDTSRSNGGTPKTVSSVTYDGVALTKAAEVAYSSDPRIQTYLYYLVNPSSGTKTITVVFSSGGTSMQAVAGSVTYTNVNQTNPLQAYNTNSGSGTSQSVSLTATGSNNKLLIGHMSSFRTSGSYSITESGQNNRWTQTGQLYKGLVSDKVVTSGSVSMSWTTSGSNPSVSWTAIAVLLRPTQVATAQRCEFELTGSSDNFNWDSIRYTLDSLSTINGVNLILQLYNYNAGQYPASGDGYISTTIGTSGSLLDQTITTNPSHFRDGLGNWKLKIKADASVTSQFAINVDLARFRTTSRAYVLDLEEKWTNVNYTDVHPTLCIRTGVLGLENLAVDVWHGGSWNTVFTGLASNTWNNVSVSPYVDSSTFTIRFRGGEEGLADSVQSSWQIDSVLLRPQSDQSLFLSLQNTVITIELLQNGTMRWLGHNLQLTTQAIPIPPVPVKSIHVNITYLVNNVLKVQEVPFQIEDWASAYSVPLGLTNNATVFSNRQMIVFLLNTSATEFTIWWDGSDDATQTSLAYTNRYFTSDNPSSNTLNNGLLRLQFGGGFSVTSTVVGTSTSSTANFMRINNEASTYGAGLAYVIHHGIVRDIVMQEAEWSTGADGCPNLYSNIVLTLPANATYYTYQIDLMFIDSQLQSRTITDLCPIKLSSTITQIQTENGISHNDPIVATGTQIFSSNPTWVHHWSQFSDGTKGSGVMFTDAANHMLYLFDGIPSAANRGALKASLSSQTIELLPVTLTSSSFQYALEVRWCGAVVTFDGAAPPIYKLADGSGLWVLAEIPPAITVSTGN